MDIHESSELFSAEVKHSLLNRGKKNLAKLSLMLLVNCLEHASMVESVIGLVRQKYTILHYLLILLCGNEDENVRAVDKIVTFFCHVQLLRVLSHSIIYQ